jgi:hypothetical protein
MDMEKARHWLADFDLKALFREGLGWDRFHVQPFDVEADGRSFTVEPVAEKCGFAVFTCRPADGGAMPDYPTRRKVEQRVRKLYHEHFVVFTDGKQSEQKWLWVRREPGKPAVGRGYDYAKGQPGDSLLQRVRDLAVELDEELNGIVITDMVGKVRRGFDRDKVSKKFYDRFKKEHAGFLKFIKGMQDEHLKGWYASVMLNRLMFIYFIQKKGFLGEGDFDYLTHKLIESKARGKDRFYRDFLCPLFFDGFAKEDVERGPRVRELLGKVPYLNGGIFLPHKELEVDNDYRQRTPIADAAFDALFAFFEEFDWVLQPRPPGYYAEHPDAREEISPDVLGYIFEKYINAIQPGEQKAKGAYYTKEDITEYISRNTVVPRLLDMTRQKCKVAFEGNSSVWRLLAESPDSYIFKPVRQGVIDDRGNVIPESRLPDFVQKVMHDPKARMFEKRYNLGDAELLKGDGNRLTLPTETWREYVARRERCLELREKLAKGEIKDVNDLITYNLDIRQFAQDVVADSDPDLLRAVWRGLNDISVLDPTCGSGAFLFAALNILEPLYEACLERMRGLLEDLEKPGTRHSLKKYDDFREALDQVAKHPKESYFVLKSIVVNNLFGVDIMDEAVEICKLRLFLKLVAQIDHVEDIEPLPDIDFNIRAGNTLVGFATESSMADALYKSKNAKQTGLLFGEHQAALASMKVRLEDLQQELDVFRSRQLAADTFQAVPEKDKEKVEVKRDALNEELSPYLARWFAEENIKTKVAYGRWLKSHKPFHWFVEFYGKMKSGGFDVIIGNPPYVETKNVSEYGTKGYTTEDCGDLYALVLERATDLGVRRGRVGMIVPMSCFSVDGFAILQTLYHGNASTLHVSHWSGDAHPARLFEGVDKRLEIVLAQLGRPTPAGQVFTSKYTKWYSDERPLLFALYPFYVCLPERTKASFFLNALPKIRTGLELRMQERLRSAKTAVGQLTRPAGRIRIYYTRKVSFFFQFLDFVPEVRDARGRKRDPSELKELTFADVASRDLALACLSSSTFYWYNVVNSDCRNLNKREVVAFPVSASDNRPTPNQLSGILRRLTQNYQGNSSRRTVDYRGIGSITVQYFNFRPAKPIIDEIDQVLAKHYGFTDEELDFIINYDIKYRMGRGAGED